MFHCQQHVESGLQGCYLEEENKEKRDAKAAYSSYYGEGNRYRLLQHSLAIARPRRKPEAKAGPDVNTAVPRLFSTVDACLFYHRTIRTVW